MLTRGEADVAYLLDELMARSVQDDPKMKLAFSGGIGTFYLDFLDMWDAKSPWADPRVRKAASLAIDRKAFNEAETLGASKPNGNIVLKSMEYALPIEPDPYDPKQAKKLLAEAGYPNGFDGGEIHPWPPYFSTGEAIVSYLGAIGIRTRLRTQERAAFYAALGSKKLKGICMCVDAVPGNASTRLSQVVPKDSNFAYGGGPKPMSSTRSSSPKPIRRSARSCCTRCRKRFTNGRGSRRSTIIAGRAASVRASRKPRWRGSSSIRGRPRLKT